MAIKKSDNKFHSHYFCPNSKCKCHKNPEKGWYIKKGYFKTKYNHQPVPRYQCKECGKKFSSQSFKDTKYQKKPFLNKPMFEYYSSGMTQRRLAQTLKCNRKTVIRKFLFLAVKAKKIHTDRIAQDDKLFMINHTCALLRQDLSRLRRRTWITTKKPERLYWHLYLYIAYRNGYNLSRTF